MEHNHRRVQCAVYGYDDYDQPVLVDSDYPNRLSYKLIEEATAVVKKRLDGLINDKQSSEQLAALISKYEDPSSLDKLTHVNTKVDEVRVRLNDNISNLVNNQMDLEVFVPSYHRKLKPILIN